MLYPIRLDFILFGTVLADTALGGSKSGFTGNLKGNDELEKGGTALEHCSMH